MREAGYPVSPVITKARWRGGVRVGYRSLTSRVVELSSNSTTSERDRRKSLNDLNPNDFSLNDGSIRFICALTAELCSHSTSSFSRPICRARVSNAVACSLRVGLLLLSCGCASAAGVLARGVRVGMPGNGVVDDELVARGGQCPARSSRRTPMPTT